MGRPTMEGGVKTKDMKAPAAGRHVVREEKETGDAVAGDAISGVLQEGFAQHAHGLLDRTIGEAEQHGVLCGR